MSTSAGSPNELRRKAAQRLQSAQGPQQVTAIAVDALAALHTLAESPSKAEDALALLHELQVHQVELELQAQALRESRLELESALQVSGERFDRLPVACFTLDEQLVVCELNRRAADALGMDQALAQGLLLDGFLSVQQAQALRAMIAQLQPDAPARELPLQLQARDQSVRQGQLRLSRTGHDPLVLACFWEAA
ncbi:PAS domain-containing protein [Roseateles sp.]|jgi:hypothetical protein|uniref:PAS domain-containing protein n=1 Tax=Roseateles sp. TaxID=1971397 RepID=UPI0037C97D89